MKTGVIVVAGGHGMRMGASVPKQFLPLSDDRCVLEAAVERFAEALPDAGIAVVLPGDHIEMWHRLNREHGFCVPHTVVAGGVTRFLSVKCGLEVLPQADIIAVTDGVRPFVSCTLVRRLVAEAAEYGSAVASTPVSDTLRHSTADGSEKADRGDFFTVQTPQVFRGDMLREAYRAAGDGDGFTDDASVVEACGMTVRYTVGERSNIKITSPEDMPVARALYAMERACGRS